LWPLALAVGACGTADGAGVSGEPRDGGASADVRVAAAASGGDGALSDGVDASDAPGQVVDASPSGIDAMPASALPPFGNETLHADRISFYMVPDLESAYTGNWPAVGATFAKLHQLMPDAWVRWDNETGHSTNSEAQVTQYVTLGEQAKVGMIVAASASPNYNNMWANQYVTGNPNAEASASILDIANGGFLGFTNSLLTGHANVMLVETLNEPDGPGWFVTDPDSASDFDVYLSKLYPAMGITAGNQASAAKLVGPAVAFEGTGKIWGDWMGRSELTNVSYHTYGEPPRTGLHDVTGKKVYVTEYGFQTTAISPAGLLDDLWNIEKSGTLSGTIQKVFYSQFMQNGSNPSAFSENIENGQAHFAERGWFRGLAAWVALANLSPNAERDDAHPDYLSTDDRLGNVGVLLWNNTAGTESGQTRTTHNTSAAAGATLNVLHVLYANNTDSSTADCKPISQQNVVSGSVDPGSVSITIDALGPREAVYVSTRPCDDLAN
jgi:hypothetical protein